VIQLGSVGGVHDTNVDNLLCPCERGLRVAAGAYQHPARRFHVAHEPLERLHVLDVHLPLSELGVEDNPPFRAFFPAGIDQYVDLPPYATDAPDERGVGQH
jgi:hypothetical protein